MVALLLLTCSPPTLVVDVLLGIDIVLQKHFCLVIHLSVNILQKETANESHAGKRQGRQGRDLKPMSHSPLERLGRRGNDLVSLYIEVSSVLCTSAASMLDITYNTRDVSHRVGGTARYSLK